ncbi:glyoxalase superfamily protein [Fibrella arboris]|uniref:glyoxalase superfamily protein n=1 Tax=Fibrella arboris TaxID=3242486 RepID=UPI003522ED62
MKLSKAIPILYSTDVARSLAYYTTVLGFADQWEWESPPSFGGVAKDEVALFFCLEDQGNPGTWLSLMVDDVDAYYDTIKANGATIVRPPTDEPWNMREMLVKDPDGHILRFGHSLECEPANDESTQ